MGWEEILEGWSFEILVDRTLQKYCEPYYQELFEENE